MAGALPCGIRIRKALEFPTPKSPLLKGGGMRQHAGGLLITAARSADGGLPYSIGAEGAQPLRTFSPSREGKGDGMGRHGSALPNGCTTAAGQSSVRFADSSFQKGAFWPVHLPAAFVYGKRWGSPLPKAPFLKGGGRSVAADGGLSRNSPYRASMCFLARFTNHSKGSDQPVRSGWNWRPRMRPFSCSIASITPSGEAALTRKPLPGVFTA